MHAAILELAGVLAIATAVAVLAAWPWALLWLGVCLLRAGYVRSAS